MCEVNVFSKLHCKTYMYNVKCIMDKGTNIIKGLQDKIRYKYLNHLLNNVLHCAFKNTTVLHALNGSNGLGGPSSLILRCRIYLTF